MPSELVIKFIDNNDPRKLVNYIGSIDQLKSIDDIDGIIIPYQTEEFSDYNYEFMIDQIRTDADQKIARLPVILKCREEEELALVEIEGELKFDEFYSENLVENFHKESLEIGDWNKIYNNLGITPHKTSGSRHDQANKWGVYRLFKFLNEWSETNEEADRHKRELSNFDLFYKKKINEELLTETKTDEPKINVKKFIKKIKKETTKVALVDDQADDGWNNAFSLIFGKNKMHSFTSPDKFRAEKDQWNKFDLVLLDLRLEESDSKKRNVLSGNELLKEVKNRVPELPVIIITASNKYNNLIDSIDRGVNDYWVKESHELGVSKKYNIENSEKLLESIKTCLVWNNDKRPIIEKLNIIEKNIKWADPEKGINRRKAFITAQLYNTFSGFIDENLGSTVLESAFISTYSILNEITSYYFIQDNTVSDTFNILFQDDSEFVLFAHKKRSEGTNKHYYEIAEVISDRVKSGSGVKREIERYQIYYLIEKNNPKSFSSIKNTYNRLRNKRNDLQITHGNFDSSSTKIVGLKDITKLVNFINDLVTPSG